MIFRLKWLAILVCLLFLGVLAGCANEAVVPETTLPPQTQPDLTATLQQVIPLWEPAAKQLNNTRDLAVQITLQQQTTFQEQTVGVTSQMDAHYLGRGTNSLQAQIRERLNVDTYETEQTLWYADGKAYAQVKGCNFFSNMRQKAFLNTQLTLELPNPNCYSSYTLEKTEIGTILTFSGGVEAEAWLTTERKAVLLEAEATVFLAADGSWQQYQCRGRYTLDEIEYLVELTVEKSPDGPSVELPQTLGTELEDIFTPRQILLAVGRICSAQGLSAMAAERMYCQAADLDRIQKIQVCTSGQGESLLAMAEHTVELVDYTNTSRYNTKTEWFSEGNYHYAINGTSQNVVQTAPEQMRKYCQELCLRYLLTPEQLAGGEITGKKDSVILTLQPTDAFLEDIYDEIYRITKMDLDGYAQDHTDTQAQITLVLYDAEPFQMSVDIFLRRTHWIDGYAYETGYQLSQTVKTDDAAANAFLEDFLKKIEN